MNNKALVLALLLVVGCGSGSREVSVQPKPSVKAEDIASARKRVLKAPHDAEARAAFGEELTRIGQFQEAVAQFDSALFNNPSLLRAKFGRAEALYQNGKHAQAYRDYLDVLNDASTAAYVAQIAARVGIPYATRQLTAGPGDNLKGRYSLAGNDIAFQSNRDGNWEIYRMAVDGATATRLTYDPGDDESPDFSPDGRQIVFASTRSRKEKQNTGEKQRSIYLMNALDGSGVKRLISNAFDNWNPIFSPKGGWLVFVSDRDDRRDLKYGERQSDLFFYYLADSSVARFTQGFGDKSSPFVSFSGETISYINNVNGDFEIYEQGIRETNGHRMVFEGGAKGGPQCSDDGKWIVYFEKNGGNFDLYGYQNEQRKTVRLTAHPSLDAFPCMQRQGSKILFTSNRTGSYQLFEIDLKTPITREDLTISLSQMLAAGKISSD